MGLRARTIPGTAVVVTGERFLRRTEVIPSYRFRAKQGQTVDGPPACPVAGGSLKVRDLIRLLELKGWQLRSIRGSHRQFKHPSRGIVVTVPGHPGKDIPIGTLKSILKSAGIEEGEGRG